MKSLNTVHKKNQNVANKSYGIDQEISKNLWATELFFQVYRAYYTEKNRMAAF